MRQANHKRSIHACMTDMSLIHTNEPYKYADMQTCTYMYVCAILQTQPIFQEKPDTHTSPLGSQS
jgi:hypothetical protein